MKSLEDMAAIMYPDMVQEDEEVVEHEEEPKGPKLTPEQQEFMNWFNSLNLPDYEESDV